MRSFTDKHILFYPPRIAELIGGHHGDAMVVMKVLNQNARSEAMKWANQGRAAEPWPLADSAARREMLVDLHTEQLCDRHHEVARTVQGLPEDDQVAALSHSHLQLIHHCYGAEKDFHTFQFHRDELARWIAAYELDSDYNFGTPSRAASTAPRPPDKAASVEPWKMRIQIEAASYMKQLRLSGASPTAHSILDRMARWAVENNVRTGTGVFPGANYLRTHVLGGKNWQPPI